MLFNHGLEFQVTQCTCSEYKKTSIDRRDISPLVFQIWKVHSAQSVTRRGQFEQSGCVTLRDTNFATP
jgi:hypothetical protein